jgi:hypothetical protein
MTKINKSATHKVILAIFTALQLNFANSMNAVDINLNSDLIKHLALDATQTNQLFELMTSLKELEKHFNELQAYLDYNNCQKCIDAYPEASLAELGDIVINILNTKCQKLPIEIREDLVKLLLIKTRESKDYKEFFGSHVLITDLLIKTIDYANKSIDEEMKSILKLGVAPEDIKKTKNLLKSYKDKFVTDKKKNKFIDISDAIKHVNNIYDRLESILASNPIIKTKFNLSAKKDTPKKSLTISEQLALARLIDYRLSKNKK